MEQKLSQLHLSNFIERIDVWGVELSAAILVFLVFFAVSVIVKKIICGVGHHADVQKQQVLLLLGDIARIALLVFGVVTALGTMGINVSALVAGLGLTGFAMGFAFRDALSNVLAGVMILIYHPFRPGDRVAITGLEGEVTGIDLRYTTLKNEEKYYLIPNSILLTNAIILNKLPHPIESK